MQLSKSDVGLLETQMSQFVDSIRAEFGVDAIMICGLETTKSMFTYMAKRNGNPLALIGSMECEIGKLKQRLLPEFMQPYSDPDVALDPSGNQDD